ncbi:MAG: hypothetical protein ACJ8LG_07320 [Massilia sp.]
MSARDSYLSAPLAVNRQMLARYLQSQLQAYVEQNCFAARVRVLQGDTGNVNCNWAWTMTPRQVPMVSFPASGSTVLSFAYQSYGHDLAGPGGELGQMMLSPAYILNVQFVENAIVVTQHLLIYLRVQSPQAAAVGNVVDMIQTDTFTLSVDGAGRLCVASASNLMDYSSMPPEHGFGDLFAGADKLVGDMKGWIDHFRSPDLANLPQFLAQKYGSGGGANFRFLDLGFSSNQDLVAHIACHS